jgi:low molecular weight protein-tyrosine phosphatase
VADDSIRILVVCTANQCRSPLTAAALARRAAESDLPVVVTSAGIAALPGALATPPTVAAGRRIGLDLSGHLATSLDPSSVRDADLVIGLERRHIQEVVLHEPRAFGRTFTLKELARRGAEVGPRPRDQTVGDWLADVHRGRRPTELLGSSRDDDVDDPTGSATRDHHTMAEEVDDLVQEVFALLFPPVEP